MTCAVTNTTRREAPLGRAALVRIKNATLGVNYDLSLVFIGDRRSQTLNKTYRKKDTPTNVLAFPLGARSGEIFINLDAAEREYASFDSSFKKHVIYLLIHGALHLKGFDHGATMEREEQKLLARFSR